MHPSVFVVADIHNWRELKWEPGISQEKELHKGQLI